MSNRRRVVAVAVAMVAAAVGVVLPAAPAGAEPGTLGIEADRPTFKQGGAATFTVTYVGGDDDLSDIEWEVDEELTDLDPGEYSPAEGEIDDLSPGDTATISIFVAADAVDPPPDILAVRITEAENDDDDDDDPELPEPATTRIVPATADPNDLVRIDGGGVDVAEGTSVTLTAVRGEPDDELSVPFSLDTGGAPVTASATAFVFGEDSDTATVTFAVADDGEAEEPVVVMVSADGVGASFTVVDDGDAGTVQGVSFDPASVTEGETTTLTVTRDAAEAELVVDAEATAGADRISPSAGPITFARGETSVDVPVTAIDNEIVDGNATVTVSVDGLVATLTVADDDVADAGEIVSLVADPDPAAEGVTVTVTATRDATTAPLSVPFSVEDGSGRVSPASGTFEFAVGEETASVVLTVGDDAVLDDDATVTVSAGGAEVTFTVSDDGDAGAVVSLVFEPATVTEGGDAALVASRDAAEGPLEVEVALAGDLDRVEGDDLTLTFAPGDTEARVAVSTVGNDVDEPDATVTATVAGVAPATLTIADDDDPDAGEVTSIDADADTAEEGSSVTVTATRSATAALLSVPFTVDDESGLVTPASGTFEFAVGEETASVVLTVGDDAVLDDDATVTVSAGGAEVTFTVSDDGDAGAVVSLVFEPATVTEGGDAALVASRDAAEGPLEVEVALAGDLDRVEGDDLTLTFAPGDTEARVAVSTVGNDVDEPDATVTATVAGVAPATLTIADDDDPDAGEVTSIDADADTAEEGSSVTVTATRSATAALLSVPFTVDDESGLVTPASGTFEFAVGEETASVVLTVGDDAVLDDDATVTVSAGGAEVTFTVSDDGDAGAVVSLVFEPATVTEGGDAALVASRDAAEAGLDVPVEVTAGAGRVQPVPDTLTFDPGQTTARVSITAVQNALDDGDATVTVSVGGVAADLTVVDDDDASAVELAFPESLEEGETGQVTVSRIGATGEELTVTLTVSGDDRVSLNPTTVTFAAGDAADQTVTLSVADNPDDDGDGTATITASAPGATVGGQSVVTVQDDDEAGEVNFGTDAVSVDEGRLVTVEVLRSGGSSGAVAVDVAVSPGTASADDHQAPTPARLEWADGEASAMTVTVQTTRTGGAEGEETLTLRLVDPTNGLALGGQSEVTVRIVDNRAPVAADDDLQVGRTESVVLDLLANDSDPDEGSELSYVPATIVTERGNTVVCTADVCELRPTEGFAGPDSFTYTVTDGELTDSADVDLVIGPECTVFIGDGDSATPGDDVICGTEGDDDIDALGGDDVVYGLGGDDVIRGGPGDDLLAGGPGDDQLVPGSGTFEANAGPGTDVVVVTATNGPDQVSLAGGLYVVDGAESVFRQVETFQLQLQGGDDRLEVSPSETTTFEIDGGAGVDRLEYLSATLSGVEREGSIIRADGRRPVTHTAVEIVSVNQTVFIGSIDDDIVNIVSTVDLLRIDLQEGSDLLLVGLASLGGPVEINDTGTEGIDRLVVNGTPGIDDVSLGGSRVTTPSAEIEFDGIEELEVWAGDGDDELTVTPEEGFRGAASDFLLLVAGGAGIDRLVIDFDGDVVIDPAAGTIAVPGFAPIRYADFETVQIVAAGEVVQTVSSQAYWLVSDAGEVFAYGDAAHHGDLAGQTLSAPIVGITPTRSGNGYWLTGADGRVYEFGDAPALGGVEGLPLNAPIVGLRSDADGDGYYLLGGDGGVFAFDAEFHGSTGNIRLNRPVVSMATNPTASGYWFVAEDGGVFAYGDAPFVGSLPAIVDFENLVAPVVGMSATATGRGYWMVANDGGIFAFGDAAFHGSLPAIVSFDNLVSPIVAMMPTPDGGGYWLVAADGGVFAFGNAVFKGSAAGEPKTGTIVGGAPIR